MTASILATVVLFLLNYTVRRFFELTFETPQRSRRVVGPTYVGYGLPSDVRPYAYAHAHALPFSFTVRLTAVEQTRVES